MNANTKLLKTLIEQMVSKEVKKQLPILLQELLTKDAEPDTIVPSAAPKKQSNTSLLELMTKQEPQPRQVVTPKVAKTYTKDPMINAILNETVNDLSTRESGRSPYVGMDGSLSMNSNSDEGMLNESIAPGHQQHIGTTDSVLDFKGKDPAVDNLMKWDFKAILAKSMKK